MPRESCYGFVAIPISVDLNLTLTAAPLFPTTGNHTAHQSCSIEVAILKKDKYHF